MKWVLVFTFLSFAKLIAAEAIAPFRDESGNIGHYDSHLDHYLFSKKRSDVILHCILDHVPECEWVTIYDEQDKPHHFSMKMLQKLSSGILGKYEMKEPQYPSDKIEPSGTTELKFSKSLTPRQRKQLEHEAKLKE